MKGIGARNDDDSNHASTGSLNGEETAMVLALRRRLEVGGVVDFLKRFFQKLAQSTYFDTN